MRRISALLAAVAVTLPSAAFAATYQVGPSRQYTTLQQVEAILQPGDVVEVDGDATYPGDIHIRPASSGTPSNKITIRGITVNGKRPVISGGSSYGIILHGNHTVFENFEITGSEFTCVGNKANDLTLRNLHIHDCPGHGILGMDVDAGSQTIEYVEVNNTGSELYDHQIYVANDQTLFPNAVVRIQHSYIHDGNGGNNVKSRASRNEIYNNWIEGPHYHLLDLIGADGQEESLAREDSDVVGNVLIQTSPYTIARLGGDGTASSNGRYRFAFNTIVVSPSQTSLFQLRDSLESVAIHDNVFVVPNGGSPNFINDSDASWTTGSAQISAQHNFVQAGLNAPSFFAGSVVADNAGFVDYAGGDLSPATGSPLLNAGQPASGPSGYEIPNALAVPSAVPPSRYINPELIPIPRPTDGSPDTGAYEFASAMPDPGTGGGDPGTGGAGAGSGSGGSDGSGASGTGGSGSGDDGDGVGIPGFPGSDDGGEGGGDSDGDNAADDGGASSGGCSVSNTGSAGPMTILFALAALTAGLRSRRRKP